MRVAALIVLTTAAAGCSASGSARYRHSTPPALPAAGPAQPPPRVGLSFARFTWQATAATEREFRVYLATPGGEWLRGDRRPIGDVRSPDVETGRDGRLALYCGWGLGQEDGCDDPDEAAQGRRLVVAALDTLRAQAAGAGAVEVRDVRCFVRGTGRDGGVLWCEGVAFAGEPDPDAIDQPEPQVEARAEPQSSRWTISATASAGGYGTRGVTGTTLGLAYRAIEVGFHMVSTFDQRTVGLGGDLVGRRRLGGNVSLVVGATAMFLASLSTGGEAATDDTSRGAVGPVLGLRVEPDLGVRLFGGFGKPLAELRIGWLTARRSRAGTEHDLAGPQVELLLGLRTP